MRAADDFPWWGIFEHDELKCEAAQFTRRMSVARAARMCGVSAGTVAAWADGRALTPAMARRVGVAMVAAKNGWVGVFGTVRVPDRWRMVATTDSDGRVLVRVTQTKTDERGGA